jgi:hypothetical protein
MSRVFFSVGMSTSVEIVEAIHSPIVTHLRYAVKRR